MLKKTIKKSLTLLPSNAISRVFGVVSEVNLPYFLQTAVNHAFAKVAKINAAEASEPLNYYTSLNELFTRQLKDGARSFPPTAEFVAAPSDGRLTAFGKLENGKVVEAKSQQYRADELMGSSELFEMLEDPYFFTIYLSPRDYHRVHTPFPGDVTHMAYVPGKLFPVNKLGLNHIENLFPKNERLTTHIQSKEQGKSAAMVMVGATCVGKISVVYDNFISNTHSMQSFMRSLEQPYAAEAGSEIGCFNLGSTVVLFVDGMDFVINKDLERGQKISAGQILGSYEIE